MKCHLQQMLATGASLLVKASSELNEKEVETEGN